MSAEQDFRELFERFQNTKDAHERDILLDKLVELAPQVRFARQEWDEMQTKLSAVLEEFYTPHKGAELVN